MSPRPFASRRRPRRAGITLTEILISILIMGIGLISLATLFPLGLIRLRDAQRQSRSGLLAESVPGEVNSKGLLSKQYFSSSYYGANDPFLIDTNPFNNQVTMTAFTPAVGVTLPAPMPVGVSSVTTFLVDGGLPVCYDPLWRSVTGIAPPFLGTLGFGNFATGSFNPTTPVNEARFGAGVVLSAATTTNSFLRADPGGGNASAYGLQRITNFVPYSYPISANWPLSYPNPPPANNPAAGTIRDGTADTFISLDDVVMQSDASGQQILNTAVTNNTGTTSPLVPEFFLKDPNNANSARETRNDWRYSWLFTGRQIDTTNGTQFEGDVVVMDSRPFGFESVNSPTTGNSSLIAAGETVVEGIFGYSGNINGGTSGYGVSADRTVLLRWPNNLPDLEIKVGSWIADVTYERNFATSYTRYADAATSGVIPYSYQRCHWYQVAKRSDVEDEVTGSSAPVQAGYRRITLYTTSPLKSRTLLQAGGSPVHLNAALFMPSVVNVFRKTFYVR